MVAIIQDSPPATPPRASSPNPSRYVDTRWGELEVEMGLAVEQEMAMLKVTSPHQVSALRTLPSRLFQGSPLTTERW